MKKIFTPVILYVLIPIFAASQGVAIVKIDSIHSSFTTLRLLNSVTNVTITNQVATTVTTQTFQNNSNAVTTFKYAFPLPETAGATQIRWNYLGYWNTAALVNSPQDTTFQTDSSYASGYIPPTLDTFLGNTPLYFPVNIGLSPNDKITIELTYVQLLPYANNLVTMQYPGRYAIIQPTVDSIYFAVAISSYRLIDSIVPKNYTGWNTSIEGDSATASLLLINTDASQDWSLQYLLHPDLIGFFSFSTDSLQSCDTFGGFFTYIVEPNSSGDGDIIPKDFVLIIDHSGSMEGVKMTQADEAASFIVNNLNTSDSFNIVQFDAGVESLSGGFLAFDIANQNLALNYISTIQAGSSTNISGAFDVSVPFFNNTDTTRAKIIIFITDGMPTAGITDENSLVSHITSLINSVSPGISLYTFGIGGDVNTQLLTELALQNRGVASFLENNTVDDAVSAFYSTIQSPVLLNTSVSYDPPVVYETYPNPLPSLFKGYQMVVTGRYNHAGPVNITLNGTAFGKPVSYQYTMNLVDTLCKANSFLPKLWAKDEIDYLMTQYYLAQANSGTANQLQNQITDISQCYNVVSPFTSFSDITNSGGSDFTEIEQVPGKSELNIFPNPASNFIVIGIPSIHISSSQAQISIISLQGRLIFRQQREIFAGNNISIDLEALELSEGSYIVEVKIGEQSFLAKLVVLY